MKILHIWFTPNKKEAIISIILNSSLNKTELIRIINEQVLNYYLQYLGIPVTESYKYLPYWPISDINVDFICYWKSRNQNYGYLHDYLIFKNNLTEYQEELNDYIPDWYEILKIQEKPILLTIYIRNKTIENYSPFFER